MRWMNRARRTSLVITGAAMMSGCASTDQGQRDVIPGQCFTGRMERVAVAELVSVFRANHISLRNDHECVSPPILAEASNGSGVSVKRGESITAREGDVICTIQPDSTGVVVTRTHYRGDQMTWLSALNVLCAVFPSDDVHAARQIGNAERALHQLVLRHER
jgi:hypothetical protein